MDNGSDNRVRQIKREQEEELTQKRAESFDLPYLDISKTPHGREALSTIDEAEAREAKIVVFWKEGNAIKTAVENPNDPKTQEVLKKLRSQFTEISVYIASKSGLTEAWADYPKKLDEKQLTGKVEVEGGTLESFSRQIKTNQDFKKVLQDISKTNASAAFDVVLAGALSLQATDIHIEPQEDKTLIRLKFDGILYEMAELDEHLYKLLLSRIKLLSKLKLNVHDSPQEGRFSVGYQGRTIEIRTSVLPTEYNEDIALRVLDPSFILSLPELGLRPDLEKILISHLKEPQGLILVTGPTGSGKTTTLYACINYLKSPEIKVITIEDPIEYHIEGLTQSQINLRKDYTFAAGLKAILRQDPDIVLISELRSIDSAEAALQGALAGRQVFSTLHTIDSAGTAPRLVDLGVDPTTVASALSTSIAQRLVRKLCKNCKKEKKIGEDELKQLKQTMANIPKDVAMPKLEEASVIYEAQKEGCPQCTQGFKGRIAIFEILSGTEKVRDFIKQSPSEDELRDFARKQGMTSMKQDAIIKILNGITSIDEAERVLGSL